jgi:hypothetical protein
MNLAASANRQHSSSNKDHKHYGNLMLRPTGAAMGPNNRAAMLTSALMGIYVVSFFVGLYCWTIPHTH